MTARPRHHANSRNSRKDRIASMRETGSRTLNSPSNAMTSLRWQSESHAGSSSRRTSRSTSLPSAVRASADIRLSNSSTADPEVERRVMDPLSACLTPATNPVCAMPSQYTGATSPLGARTLVALEWAWRATARPGLYRRTDPNPRGKRVQSFKHGSKIAGELHSCSQESRRRKKCAAGAVPRCCAVFCGK